MHYHGERNYQGIGSDTMASGAKILRHRMRGTVLLLESDRSLLVDVDLLRANELIVYHCHDLANALKQFQHTAPDVVVAVLSGHDSPSIVPSLRDRRLRHVNYCCVSSRRARSSTQGRR